jgi:hypothetical protein
MMRKFDVGNLEGDPLTGVSLAVDNTPIVASYCHTAFKAETPYLPQCTPGLPDFY